jgi:hypothetical protein
MNDEKAVYFATYQVKASSHPCQELVIRAPGIKHDKGRLDFGSN